METDKKGTVYISQENKKHNYAEAVKYGELYFIADSEYMFPKVYNMPSQGKEIEWIKDVLAEFNPETDFLLLDGCPVFMSVIASIVYAKSRGRRVKLLQWSSLKKAYVVVSLCVQLGDM